MQSTMEPFLRDGIKEHFATMKTATVAMTGKKRGMKRRKMGCPRDPTHGILLPGKYDNSITNDDATILEDRSNDESEGQDNLDANYNSPSLVYSTSVEFVHEAPSFLDGGSGKHD